MKVTNKSELFKAAWKMFRANKITFSEALKYAWGMLKAYQAKVAAKANETAEDKELKKAMNWARVKVSDTITSWDFEAWKAFAAEHKSEGTIWQLAAKYARIQDSIFYSFC
ncbi:hypothetical protein ACUJ42_05265 [Streptococcus anginosus]|uniref:hypothetical protein n=1 Tax=Streptococcus anginosus TaxID=1328 RepID=UPI0040424A72